MAKSPTFVDADVLINAFRGIGPTASAPQAVLDDPDREFVVSDIRIVPDTPVNMEHIAKAQEEYVKLLIKSVNEKLQLAYIKQSIIGTLEMVLFDDWNVTLGGFKKEIKDYAADGDKERNFEAYVRLRAQLAVLYAGIFKKKYGMSFSPKVERLLSKMQDKAD